MEDEQLLLENYDSGKTYILNNLKDIPDEYIKILKSDFDRDIVDELNYFSFQLDLNYKLFLSKSIEKNLFDGRLVIETNLACKCDAIDSLNSYHWSFTCNCDFQKYLEIRYKDKNYINSTDKLHSKYGDKVNSHENLISEFYFFDNADEKWVGSLVHSFNSLEIDIYISQMQISLNELIKERNEFVKQYGKPIKEPWKKFHHDH